MHNPSSQERIRRLYQMLFEMATGNLSFRLERSESHDVLDDLAGTLNSLAAEMQAALVESGYVTPHYTYQSLVQSTLLLDSNYSVSSFSTNAAELFGYAATAFNQIPFVDMLAAQSLGYWQQLVEQASGDEAFHQTVQLIFTTKNGKVIPSFCTISRLRCSDKLLVSTITTILQGAFSDMTGHVAAPRIPDSAVIQDVQDYILNNLEEPLPTVKELSKMFGTNEFKIKDGFRNFFHTSVYQFYNEARLKKAHLMIQQTDQPLKVIALMSGFNDYTNFYKSFKKRFNYSPSDVKREGLL
jgi:AraC-like DNA-binding protein